jgi:23S rRNA-/tRNA-specific pseudouridylate synthase
MTIVRGADEGREAYTDFTVVERFAAPFAQLRSAGPIFYVRAFPQTGRTHQIRVHLAKSGYPVLADSLYGKESALPEYGLYRQALHAQRLVLRHPCGSQELVFEAPLPADMRGALEKLRGSSS